jgi:hypothetical protein
MPLLPLHLRRPYCPLPFFVVVIMHTPTPMENNDDNNERLSATLITPKLDLLLITDVLTIDALFC